MPDGPRPFTPRRWRRWTGFVILGLMVLLIVVTVARSPHREGLVLLAVLPPVGVLVLYLIRLTGGVTVVPRREIRWRGPLLGRRRMPIDGTTTIVWYRNVVGSGASPIRTVRTPIGTMDNRWAMVQTDGAPILRLSMRYWEERSLRQIAQIAPARLRIVNDLVDPARLAAEEPRLYTRIELRPRLYQLFFVLWLSWFMAAVGAVLLVIGNGLTW